MKFSIYINDQGEAHIHDGYADDDHPNELTRSIVDKVFDHRAITKTPIPPPNPRKLDPASLPPWDTLNTYVVESPDPDPKTRDAITTDAPLDVLIAIHRVNLQNEQPYNLDALLHQAGYFAIMSMVPENNDLDTLANHKI